MDKETAQKMKGRGEVKITKAVPKTPTRKAKEETIRNAFMYKANDNLKQARRCEQINHRIMRSMDAEGEKRGQYEELNAIIVKGVRKNLDMKDEQEKEFDAKLRTYLKKEIEE